jgi:peptidylprolyl isomerase
MRSLMAVLALVVLATPVFAEHHETKADEKMAANKGEKVEVAVMKTTMGDIVFELYADVAPKAVENFTRHSKSGYYEGIVFHRIIEGFMIQGGDPTGTGRGGKSVWQVPFEDEFSPDHRFDGKGILAMANAGPKTNGSQFFITLAETPWLNDRHTIFGRVVDGMDVVEAMGSVETGPGDKPIKDVQILSVSIEERVLDSE